MLISYRHNFIFIHINKTAGTSIAQNFAPYARWVDRLVYGYGPTRKIFTGLDIISKRAAKKWITGFHKHATAYEIKRRLPPQFYNNFFKFAFVRNPWDRCVSQYFFLKHTRTLELHRFVRDMDFTEFLEWQIRRQIKRQCDFITDKQGSVLVDYIGKFENLDDDLLSIQNKLNLNLHRLPRLNPSKQREEKNYRKFYDHQSRALVGHYFQEDVRMFNYTF